MTYIKILIISLIVSTIASIISIQSHAATGFSESLSLLTTPAYIKLWAVSFISIFIASVVSVKLCTSKSGRSEVAISGNQEPPAVQSYRRTFSEPIPGSGFDDLAVAHSQVLERLCREVAVTLEDLISS